MSRHCFLNSVGKESKLSAMSCINRAISSGLSSGLDSSESKPSHRWPMPSESLVKTWCTAMSLPMNFVLRWSSGFYVLAVDSECTGCAFRRGTFSTGASSACAAGSLATLLLLCPVSSLDKECLLICISPLLIFFYLQLNKKLLSIKHKNNI